MKNKINKSEIFRCGWAYLRSGTYLSFSDALKAAWRKYKLLIELSSGLVHFAFRKKDGTVRTALGTLKDCHIEVKPKGIRETPAHLVAYWDMMKGGWRSFRIDSLIN